MRKRREVEGKGTKSDREERRKEHIERERRQKEFWGSGGED